MSIIWVIGVLFTLGYILDTKNKPAWVQVKIALLIVFLWPMVLGAELSKRKPKGGQDDT